jgi:GAF domain-containing protein
MAELPASGALSQDRRYRALLDLSRLLRDSLSGDQSLAPLFDLLRELVPFEGATLYRYDARTARLIDPERFGTTEVDLIDSVRFEMGFGLSAWIAKQRRPVILPNLRRKSGLPSLDLRSFIGLPLVLDDELLGVINFGHTEPDAFADVDPEPLQILATQIALLLKNLKLVGQLKQRNEELRERNRQLKEMQQQLVESERVKAMAEVVATMNHEINNPLTVISGNAELLALELADTGSDSAFEKIARIQQQTRRLGRVLNLLASIKRPVLEAYPDGSVMLDLAASTPRT